VRRAAILDDGMPFQFPPMDEASARTILAWRYEAPYDIYNLDLEGADQVVGCFVEPANAYYTILDSKGELIAYCCFGSEGRVPGGDYESPALDIGLGVRPDLTGRGLGDAFVEAVLGFAKKQFAPSDYRVTVAEFNKRALRVWEKAGFRPLKRFERTFDGMPFVVLTVKSK
jgi:ribosomal-protein-alanine N-acetyltransferase